MKALLTMLLMSISLAASASDWGADRVVTLWDNSSAPHSNGYKGEMYDLRPNRPTNIVEAKLYIFEAKGEPTSQAVVLCPGGGYNVLSMDEEGSMMAEWLTEQGITAAVLQYRTPNGVKEVPLEDVERAIATMREMSDELAIDPKKVGVFGASAGGHLAASASTLLSDGAKPNFTILFYPVITGKEGVGHQGSFSKLLGAQRTAELVEAYSLENRVTSTTPPAIIFHCDDDRLVPAISSTLYYNALKMNGVPASLHIYPTGGHGWGNSDRPTFRDDWQMHLSLWLEWINK